MDQYTEQMSLRCPGVVASNSSAASSSSDSTCSTPSRVVVGFNCSTEATPQLPSPRQRLPESPLASQLRRNSELPQLKLPVSIPRRSSSCQNLSTLTASTSHHCDGSTTALSRSTEPIPIPEPCWTPVRRESAVVEELSVEAAGFMRASPTIIAACRDWTSASAVSPVGVGVMPTAAAPRPCHQTERSKSLRVQLLEARAEATMAAAQAQCAAHCLRKEHSEMERMQMYIATIEEERNRLLQENEALRYAVAPAAPSALEALHQPLLFEMELNMTQWGCNGSHRQMASYAHCALMA